MEYYKNNYGIDIIDVDQPMLISKARNRTGDKVNNTLYFLREYNEYFTLLFYEIQNFIYLYSKNS